jgi:hypothetical protein
MAIFPFVFFDIRANGSKSQIGKKRVFPAIKIHFQNTLGTLLPKSTSNFFVNFKCSPLNRASSA